MRRNKKLLMFLALNSLATSFAGTINQANVKYNKLYTNMTKNIETGKSNESNYKLIQDVLNKRNQELKDLYLQSDYIVKPEFLEWQIFFTGFYNHLDRGGNRKERDIPFVESDGKIIDLGVIIPIKGKTINKIDLNVISPSEPVINLNKSNIIAPTVDEPSFSFTPMEIPSSIQLYSSFISSFAGEAYSQIGTNTNNVQYNTSGSTIYENLNVSSVGKTLFEINSSGTLNATGVTSYNNGAVTGNTPASYTYGSPVTDTFSVMNIGNNGNYTVNGDWELRTIVSPSYITNNYGFISYRPYYITSDGKVEFTGNLDLTASTTTARQKVGLYLDLGNQASISGVTATLENKGIITVTDTGTALQLNSSTKNGTVSGNLINSGTINLNSAGTFNYHATGIQVIMHNNSESGKAIVKIGNINVNGINDDGVLIRSYYGYVFEAPSNVILDGSNGIVTLNGERNQGITVSKYMGPSGSTNALDNIKNLNIIVNGRIGVGIAISPSEVDQSNDYIISDKMVESIVFGPDSRSSAFFSGQYFSQGKSLILDESLKNSIGVIDTGTMNTIVTTDTASTVINNAPIEITENAKAMYTFATQQINPVNFIPTSKIINNASIINNSSAYTESGITYGALGLGALSIGATIINNGSIDMDGKNAIGVFNKGTAESKSDHIIINNDMGVAIYGTYGSTGLYPEYVVSQSKVSANKLEVNGNNGVVLYSKAGDIELSPLVSGGSLEITANGDNTFAFYHETATKKLVARSGKFIIKDTVNVNLKNGAIGFYYDANWGNADIPGYFANIVDTSNGQLNITTDENSYKMAIGRAIVNVSDLSNLSIPNINFIGDSGKIKVFNGLVNVDMDSDLDKNNLNGDKTYRDLEIGQSSISIQSGIKVTGTEDSLVGIAQSARYNEPTSSASNGGTIDLKGNSSIGIYNKRGYSENTGIIDVAGNNGIGMYEVSGYNSNTGEIRIKDNGIGIYNTTYLDPEDNPYNSSYSTIENNGAIISNGGNKSIGIFANNNTSYGYMDLILNSSSDIDVSSSNGGIGVYGINSNIYGGWSDSGKISVGENGVGIYGKDSTINLDNLELNLIGDKAVGFYLEGTSNFTGTGNINIDGKDITVFNLLNTGTFNQNFNILSTMDSSYTFQNLSGLTSYYNSVASLGQGGVFISGLNSAVLLDINSQLISNNSNLVAIALDGQYSGLTNINGVPVTNEATNKGEISFGDNSVGLYVKNGASALNTGTISLGEYSAGLYGIGIGTNVENTGDISIGSNSTGLYLKDGDKLTNSGNILSSGNNVVGLFLDGAELSEINNTGKIDLSGNESVGIYDNSTQIHTINNSREILVGDSGVAIFNNNINGIITNSADITGGSKSVGLYNNGGTVNHLSGDIKTGSGGVDVYTVSGRVNLNAGKLNVDDLDEVGIYGKTGAIIDNNMELDIAQNNYGIILDNSNLINRNKSVLGENSVLLYSNNGSSVFNDIGADIKMNASNSIAFYMENGGNLVNKAEITGNSGIANIGIYTKSVSVDNSGGVKVGDSLIIDAKDPTKNFYSVGIYNQDSIDFKNTGKIEMGADAFGLYVENNSNKALNSGNITSNANGAVGIYTVKGTLENSGDITLSGDKSIGIAATLGSKISNSGNITVNGSNSMGIYASLNSAIINEKTGAIYINGNSSTGIQLSGGSTLENYGKIEVAFGTINSTQIGTGDAQYEIPSIINAGVIKVDEKFDLNGLNLIIKADLNSFRVPTIEEITQDDYSMEDINAGFLLTNSVQIIAPEFDFGTKAVKLDPLFTQGTNARVYKFENVFDPMTPDGGLNSGELTLKSGSLTFDAIPNINSSGKVDIWMEKINYDQFTEGLWYDSFAKNIENKYLNATGDALVLYDKLDLIDNIKDFDRSMEQLSGNMYANINQREQNINEVFNNALNILQNSENNTKENVKVNIIAGKGSTKENTSGVESYDYETTGVLVLREVERTYRHKFGYSLGYTRTDFQMKDTNNEDQADTIQIGLHNKYSVNGWNIKNDLLGRVSFHDVDRSVDWSSGTKSDLNSNYNVYGVSSLNELGKELEINKNAKITPYVGLELGYMMHPSFEEKGGAESLKVDSNDAYSVKPNIGVRLDGEKEFGVTSSWKLKGNIGVGYEYELGNMNNQEKASLTSIEDGYHELAKAAEDKGRIKTSGYAGVELKETYGIYITGEYGIGQDKQEDYKIGVSLKAMF